MLKILIDTANIATSSELDRFNATDRSETLGALERLFKGIKSGNYEGYATVAIQKNAVAASAIVTFGGEVSVNDTVTVNGVVFTAVASPSTAVQFQAHATAATAAASLVLKVNANTSAKLAKLTAGNVLGVITLTADEAGASGNGYTVAKSGTNIEVTNDFAGGSNGTDYSITK